MNILKILSLREFEKFSAVTIQLFAWLSTFTIFVVLDDKGGVGKSFIAQIIAAIVKYFEGHDVLMVDTDYSNSSTAQVEPSAKMLNLDEKAQMGVLINLVKKLASVEGLHAVIDAGARDEGKLRERLPWLTELARKAGGRVVVIRPITLGSHNQRNASSFMDIAQLLKIPTVFVCNEGQGRQPEYFDRWKSTETCRIALEKGAVQTVITDADVRYADEAVGLGLSMLDVAVADFSKLNFAEELAPDADPETQQDFERRREEAALDRAAAIAFFTDDIVAFIAEWLRINIFNIGSAIQEAIERRAALDADEQPEVETTSARRKRR